MSPSPGFSSLRRVGVLTSLLICGTAAVSHAQTGGGHPQRPFRGIFGGGGARDPQAPRTSVSLLLGLNGTYDEHLAPRGIGGTSADPSTSPAGSIAAFDGTLQIERVRPTSSFGVSGSGFVSRYSTDPAEVTTGGALVARASRNFGRDLRNSLFASQSLRYDPLYTGNGQSLIRPIGFEGTANADPTGLYFRDSWTSTSQVGLSTQASRRDRLNFGYGFTIRDYPDEGGGDIKQHNVTVAYDREFSRSLSLQTNYQLGKADFDLNARFGLPLYEQSITVGPQYVKRFSPTRRLTLGGGLGGTYVKERDQLTSVETTTWSPTGQANAMIDLGRSWVLGGNYARSVTLLEGLTREQLLLDSGTISLRGVPHERVEFSSAFGISIQASDTGQTTGVDSDFRTKNFSMQSRIALTQMLALQLSYAYYAYDFGAAAELLEGIPRRFSRNVGTVGLTVWLPVYGRTIAAPRP
jgi:hypothetical protein